MKLNEEVANFIAKTIKITCCKNKAQLIVINRNNFKKNGFLLADSNPMD